MPGIDNRTARTAWTYALVGIALVAIYEIRAAIVVFVLALMFAYLLYPLVEMTQRVFKLKNRMVAVALPFAVILAALAVGGYFLQGSVVRQSLLLCKQVQSGALMASLENWKFLGMPIGREFAQSNGSAWLTKELNDHMPEARLCLKHVMNGFSDLFIVPILAFFMLKDGKWICDCLLDLCFHPQGPRESLAIRRVVERVMNDAHTLIQEYMRSLVLLCFSVLIVFSTFLTAAGVHYAIILAVIAFALEFIPMVGPLASGAIIVVVSSFTGYGHLGLLVAFLIGFRIFQDYMLSPYLMRHSVQLHPLLVVFGAFAGAELGGIGGVFLSVPLLAVSRMAFYEYRKYLHSRWMAKRSKAMPVIEELASAIEADEVAEPAIRNRFQARRLNPARFGRKQPLGRVRRALPTLA